MKNLFYAAALLLSATFVNSTAGAVATSQCPQRILIDMKDFKVTRSLQYILANDLYGDPTGSEYEKVKQGLKNVAIHRGVQRLWSITQRENGRCVYTDGKSYEKAELYTTNGNSVLMIQTDLGPNGVMLRVYASVMSVTPGGIQFSRTSSPGLSLAVPRSSYGHYSAGGPLVFIGQVNTFSVTAR